VWEGARVQEGARVWEGARVQEGERVWEGARVWEGKKVWEGLRGCGWCEGMGGGGDGKGVWGVRGGVCGVVRVWGGKGAGVGVGDSNCHRYTHVYPWR
jgi:hypothetical protein